MGENLNNMVIGRCPVWLLKWLSYVSLTWRSYTQTLHEQSPGYSKKCCKAYAFIHLKRKWLRASYYNTVCILESDHGMFPASLCTRFSEEYGRINAHPTIQAARMILDRDASTPPCFAHWLLIRHFEKEMSFLQEPMNERTRPFLENKAASRMPCFPLLKLIFSP